MLQADKPDDYVLSTNEFHSVMNLGKLFALKGFQINGKDKVQEIGYDEKTGKELIFFENIFVQMKLKNC